MNQGFVLLIAGLFGLPAAPPSSPAADPTAPVRQFIDAFNRGDMKTAFSTYASGQIVIVDEFAPHRWIGPNAPQLWAADYGKHAKATGVTDGKVTYGPPTRVEIEGSEAYVVMPTVYLYREKGLPLQEEGQVTAVLHSEAGSWKMRGWTWSGAKPHPART